MSAKSVCEALGEDGEEIAEQHAPVAIEGLEVSATLRPTDGASLGRVLEVLTAEREAVLVRGGGTRIGFGNLPTEVCAVLSTERLRGIEEFDADDGVARVRAGTPITEIAGIVDAAGWELPLDAPGAATTIGGVLATGATGPRRGQFGAPRGAILGLDVALATGERTSCGGRVVKNVTGYDMAKLYSGSFGSLGVIESAWLRLRPKPQVVKTAVVAFDGGDPLAATRIGLEASRRDTARVAALVSGEPATALGAPARDGGAAVLVVEYGGDAPAVERDLAWLLEQAGGREVPEASRLVGRLRDLQGSGEVRARLATVPTQLPTLQGAVAGSGFGTIAYPGDGIVYAIAPSGAVSLDALVAAAASLPAPADLVFEALPVAARRDRDVFGDPGPTAKIARAIKDRFDPARTLNPGRFQGRL